MAHSDERMSAYEELNDRQRLFVDALLEFAPQSATIQKAAEKADYDYSYARNLVTKSNIMKAVDERREALSRYTLYSHADLMNDLLTLKENCMRTAVIKDKDGNEVVRVVDSSGANSALDKLGKMMGAYTDKVEHSGEIKGVVGIEVVTK